MQVHRSAAAGQTLSACHLPRDRQRSRFDGDPYVFVYKGQEIKLCCEPCVDEFQADPDAFLAKLPK
ncbi:MAG: hypothetical protein R3E96_17070 [Planctomycetota bacterium]